MLLTSKHTHGYTHRTDRSKLNVFLFLVFFFFSVFFSPLAFSEVEAVVMGELFFLFFVFFKPASAILA